MSSPRPSRRCPTALIATSLLWIASDIRGQGGPETTERSAADLTTAELRAIALRGPLPIETRRKATEELVRRAEALDTGRPAAEAWAAATLALRTMRDTRVAAFVPRALALCREFGDDADLERMLGQAALEAAQVDDFDRAVTLLREAVAICRDLGAADRLAAQLSSLAIYTRSTGAVEDAVSLAEQGLEVAREAGDKNVEGVILNSLGAWLLELGRYAEARASFDLALERVVHPMVRFIVAGGLADVTLREGDPLAARARLEEMLRDPHQAVARPYLGAATLLLARTYEAEGDWPRALELAVEAIESLGSWPSQRVEARVVQGHCLRELGRPDESLEVLRAAIGETAEPTTRLSAMEGLAHSLVAAGRHEEGFEALQEVLAAHQERETRNARARLGALRSSHEFRALEDAARASAAQRDLAEARAATERAERQRAEADAARTRRDAAVALVGGALLGLAAWFVLRARSRHRRAQERLQREEALRAELQERFDAASAELRREGEERLALERELEAARRHEAVGRLTAGVAHDFNNLLQVLGQSSELLSLDDRLSTAQRELLDSCRQSVETGARITSQLLSYARRQKLAPAPAAVGELLAAARELFRSAVGDRHVLETRDESEGARILVDSGGLTTAVLELLDNARDATPPGGVIELRATCSTEGPTAGGMRHTGRYACVEVRDPGRGMTDEQVARACEPFYTDKDVASGTGLGLSTVYGFVAQSNGAMEIDSAPGRGTTVSLWFPLVAAETARAEGAGGDDAPRAAAPRARRCLVVDDDVLVRETMAQAVASLGIAVDRCATVDEARARLERDPSIDLVVTDVRMPGGKSGVQLARWIRGRAPGIGIVLVTGYAEERGDGFALLRKPFTLAELRTALGRELEAAAARTERATSEVPPQR